MKSLILALFLFLNFPVFGQNKLETEDWLVEKINEYAFYFRNNSLNSYANEDILKIKDGYIIGNQGIHRVKIKNIRKIKITKRFLYQGTDEEIVEVFLLFDSGKSEARNSDNGAFEVFPSVDKIRFALMPKFISDNMKGRLEKSLVHLVKLYGGVATVYKEPF